MHMCVCACVHACVCGCASVCHILCVVLQITDMLQVNPERRPSAVELVTARLPPLMEQLIREEEEEEEPEANEEGAGGSKASQRARSAHSVAVGICWGCHIRAC